MAVYELLSHSRTTAHYVGKSLGPPVGKDGFADESFDSRIILVSLPLSQSSTTAAQSESK